LLRRAQKPRCMGFVGYRTDAEATAAAKYFNGTYLDTSKLTVEVRRLHAGCT
jgi:hypothetical protein